MADTYVRAGTAPANITLRDIRHVARALKRLHEMDAAPALGAENREEIAEAKRVCWSVVGSATEALVSLMDAIAGDPDLEGDPFNEGEPAFDRESREMVSDGKPGDTVTGDAEPASWLERPDQSKPAYGHPTHAHFQNAEDCEDDDPLEECVTEDEPGFDKRSRRLANAFGADGPGGGSLLDSDCGDGGE